MNRFDLDAIPLFATLPDAGRDRVAAVARQERFKPGAVITDEGAVAYYFFAIESGTAEVTVRGEPVAELGPGDFFGEIGALPHEDVRWGRRRATVTAKTRLSVVELPDYELRDLIDEFPSFGRMLRDAARMRERAGVTR